MMLAACIVLRLATTAVGGPPGVDLPFNDYVAMFNKSYPTALERERRRQIYEAGMAQLRIEAATASPSRGHTARYGPTPFSDFTQAEVEGLLLGGSRTALGQAKAGATPVTCVSAQRTRIANRMAIPESLDWRDKSSSAGLPVVTPIKNQGACGSCWAFAGVEIIESAWINADMPKIGADGSLSVQHVLDCTASPGPTSGCNGGEVGKALQYAIADVIPSQAAEPYKCSKADSCDQMPACPGNTARPTSLPNTSTSVAGAFIGVRCQDGFFCDGVVLEDEIKLALSSNGPVAVNVDARAWYKYQSGIIRDNCGGDDNHAVVLVGYGTEMSPDGDIDYWIVRNSWGTDWGEDGYIRLYRDNSTDTCGFAQQVSAASVHSNNGKPLDGFDNSKSCTFA